MDEPSDDIDVVLRLIAKRIGALMKGYDNSCIVNVIMYLTSCMYLTLCTRSCENDCMNVEQIKTFLHDPKEASHIIIIMMC